MHTKSQGYQIRPQITLMSIIMAGCIGYIAAASTVLILLHGTSGKHDEGILASISMTTQNVNGAVTQQLMRSIFRFEIRILAFRVALNIC